MYLSGLSGLAITLWRIVHRCRALRCLYALTFAEWLSLTTALTFKSLLLSMFTQFIIPS